MIVAVYAVKGGAGRTTIAVNLAAALGQKHRGDCVLLDLSLPYNHAALVANLVPTGCLALCERPDENHFEEAVLGAGLHHHTGMVVLPSALRVEQSELVTPILVQRALAVLEETFTYIVVDLGVAMTEVTLGVLERANRILVMVTAELPTLKDTAELLQIFEKVLDIPPERVVKRPMNMEIAYDGARFDRAAVMGEVLVSTEPSSAAARTLIKLASSISDDHKGRSSKRG